MLGLAITLIAGLLTLPAKGQEATPIIRKIERIVPVPNGVTDLGIIPMDARRLAAISMQPPIMRFSQIGQSQRMRVLAGLTDGSGYDVTSGFLGTTYTVDASTVVQVASDGTVTAIGSGATIVNAFHLGRQSRMIVQVDTTIGLGTLELAPPNIQLGFVGDRRALRVNAVFGDGTRTDVTHQTATSYQSNSPAVVHVDSIGRATARSVGTAVIEASYQGAVATAVVSVIIPAAKQLESLTMTVDRSVLRAFSARGILSVSGGLQDGSIVDLTGSSAGTFYESSASTVATVSAEGEVVPVADGLTRITASNSGESASLLLRVSFSTLQTLAISTDGTSVPLSATVPLARRQLTVSGQFSDGSTEDLTAAQLGTSYGSSNSGVAEVSSSGLVTFTQPGQATLTAFNSGKTTQATFTATSFQSTSLGRLLQTGYTNLAVSGSYAYLTAGSGGLKVIDVSNSLGPTQAASASTSGSMVDIAISGTRAFVAETSGLAVFNISNPLSPSRSNTFSGSVTGVAADGGKIYYSDGDSLKIRDASTLSLLGELSSLGTPGALSVSGGLAFVISGGNVLKVVDVSASSAPVLAASVALPGGASDIASKGRFAFIPLGRVFVVDATIPAQAAIVGQTTVDMVSQGVAVNGDTLFAADGSFIDQITVYNISRPEAPVFIDRLPVIGKRGASRVAVTNSLAYVLDTFGPLPGLYTALYAPEQPGAPPTVSLLTPAAGAKVVDGSETPVSAAAADNAAVLRVTYYVNGVAVKVSSVPPYNTTVPIPLGSTGQTIRIGVQSQDYSALLSSVSEVLVESVPDPLTTVQGRLMNVLGNPVPNTPITVAGRVQTASGPDGSFIVSHVPTWQGAVTLTATAAVSGTPIFANTRRTPVLAGVTNFGDVVLGGGGTLTGSISGTLNPLQGPFRIVGGPGGGVQVNSNNTLTLPAGTIFKFDPGTEIRIETTGSLVTQGSVGAPVVFTSMADDSIGGDTGADGPTTGAPGQWVGPRFQNSGAATSVSTSVFRFAQAVKAEGGAARLENVTISSMSIAAVVYTNPFAFITGGPLSASGNALNGIDVMPGGGPNVAVTWADLGIPYVIRNGQVDISNQGSLTIQAGTVVKLDGTPVGPGFGRFGTLSVSNRPFSVQGTVAKPVYFTSLKDDTVGGDTNADGGATAPGMGDWHGLNLFSVGTSVSNAVLRYGGQLQNGAPVRMLIISVPDQATFTNVSFTSAAATAFEIQSGGVTGQNLLIQNSGVPAAMVLNSGALISSTFTGVQFQNNRSQAIQLNAGSKLYLNDATFTGNAGYGVDLLGSNNAQLISLATASFTGNGGVIRQHPNADTYVSGTISMSNTGVQGIDLTGGTESASASGNMARSRKWRKGLPYVIRGGDVLVSESAQLDILPGAVVKLRGFPYQQIGFNTIGGPPAHIRNWNSSNSRINSLGTPQEPIYITSLLDDTVGGDTNADGFATTPSTGDWHGVQLAALAGTFQNTVLRYGGALVNSNPDSMLVFGSGASTLDSVEFSSSGGRGLQVNGPTVGQNLLFVNNGIPAALDAVNVGVPVASTFTNIQFLNNRSRGVQADFNTQLYLYNSTFTANVGYAVEALNNGGNAATIISLATAAFTDNLGVARMHPNADIFTSGALTITGGGLRGIDVTGGTDSNSAPGSMPRSHQWRKGLPYVIRGGDVMVTSSARLDLLPGTVVKLRGFPLFGASGGGPSARIRGFNSSNMVINSLGTSEEPVYITSLFDDTVGGDTNGDGFTTTPSTGDWHGVQLNGPSGTFQNTVLRYGGANNNNNPESMVTVSGPAKTFDDVVFSSAGGRGLQLNGFATGQNLLFANNGEPAALDTINVGSPTSSTFTGVQFIGNRARGVQTDFNGQIYLYGSTFTNNAGYAIEALNNGGNAATIVYLATAVFSDNLGVARMHPNADIIATGEMTITGGGLRGIDVTGGTDSNSAPGSVTRSHQWRKGLTYVIRSNDVLLTSSGQLDLQPGTVVKLRGFPVFGGGGGSARIRNFNGVNSRFRSLGTPQEPVYITSLFDDTVGGDTNADGFATSPSTGDWHAIQMSAQSPTFQNTVVRYGGALVNNNPQAMVLISGAQPAAFDGVEFSSGGGTGLQLNGTASGQNLRFANNGEPAALDVVNIGVPTSSTFTGVEFAGNRGRGVQIDSNGQVYLYNSTFTANAGYGAELMNSGGSQATVLLLSTAAFSGNAGVVRAHPNSDVLVSGAVTMSNTGIQGIDLTGGTDANTAPGTMGRSHKWTKGLPYVIRSNDMFLMSGARLDLMPGTVVKLRGFAVGSGGPFSRIRASQSALMNGLGTAAEPVYITSLLDDTVGGDTNGDGAATSPAAGNWHGIQLFGAAGAVFQNTVVRYGGANINGNPQQMLATNQSLTLIDSQFASAAGAAMRVGAATATITTSQFANNADVGLTLDSNAYAVVNDSSFTGNAEGVQFTSSSGELHNNSFTGNASFGVRNMTPGFNPIVHAQNNWWGSATGPTHAGNPGGTGNAVTNGVLYTPFLTSPP